jgi:DNA (cytosine-5)-methyltransferase 1
MRSYYNEHDPDAAQWLRNLIAAGLIADGDVDERSIEDVLPSDLAGYTQCHFFAGIGGWSAALRLAGWPDDRPVWTGSCPCQPFSAAGKGAAFADERHLWPAFHSLIAQCRPPVVFGEQVASPDGLQWIDLVHADLEGAGYAFGSADLCAAGVGAPHIRQRLYFVADADFRAGNQGRAKSGRRDHRSDAQPRAGLGGGGESDDLANARSNGLERGEHQGGRKGATGIGRGLADTSEPCGFCGHRFDVEKLGRYGCPNCEGVGRLGLPHHNGCRPGRTPAQTVGLGHPTDSASGGVWPGPLHGFWRDADWLYCRDTKWRPIEPGLEPLVNGLPISMGRLQPRIRRLADLAGADKSSFTAAKRNRVTRLRGYGNAIAPELAAVFIRAYLGGPIA